MLKNIVQVTLIGMALLYVNGCGANGPEFTGIQKPNKGKASVYVYRTALMGAAVNPDIHKQNMKTGQDEVLGSVKSKGYILTTVDPGMYKFWAKTEARNEVDLKVDPNQIYCIEHYISIGVIVGHPKFKIVDMAKCEEELKKTKLSVTDKKTND